MDKLVFHGRALAVIACALVFMFLSVPAAFCQTNGVGGAEYHNQQGIAYFKQGFYHHTPKNQAADAERNYGLAVREFQAAIAEDPFFTDAHRNLARLYYVKKNFDEAAKEYRRVTELRPGDLDAYVNLALSLVELGKFDEALQTLEKAKHQTSDQKALNTLDTYISKLLAHRTKEVR
jgi:tetratricopeptide (TPR) repeat protein